MMKQNKGIDVCLEDFLIYINSSVIYIEKQHALQINDSLPSVSVIVIQNYLLY